MEKSVTFTAENIYGLHSRLIIFTSQHGIKGLRLSCKVTIQIDDAIPLESGERYVKVFPEELEESYKEC